MRDSTTSDIKETIIRESTRLFLANGFRGTSVKQITEAVGIGRGTLYWYFKSKEEILESVFRKFERQFVVGVEEAVKNCEGDFTAKYKVFHKFATEFARDNRELALAFNGLLMEIVGTGTKGEMTAKAVWEKFRHVLEEILEEGKQDGIVDSAIVPAVYSHVVVACHTGMLVQWLVSGGSLDVRLFVKTFRDLLLNGMTDKAK